MDFLNKMEVIPSGSNGDGMVSWTVIPSSANTLADGTKLSSSPNTLFDGSPLPLIITSSYYPGTTTTQTTTIVGGKTYILPTTEFIETTPTPKFILQYQISSSIPSGYMTIPTSYISNDYFNWVVSSSINTWGPLVANTQDFEYALRIINRVSDTTTQTLNYFPTYTIINDNVTGSSFNPFLDVANATANVGFFLGGNIPAFPLQIDVYKNGSLINSKVESVSSTRYTSTSGRTTLGKPWSSPYTTSIDLGELSITDTIKIKYSMAPLNSCCDRVYTLPYKDSNNPSESNSLYSGSSVIGKFGNGSLKIDTTLSPAALSSNLSGMIKPNNPTQQWAICDQLNNPSSTGFLSLLAATPALDGDTSPSTMLWPDGGLLLGSSTSEGTISYTLNFKDVNGNPKLVDNIRLIVTGGSGNTSKRFTITTNNNTPLLSFCGNSCQTNLVGNNIFVNPPYPGSSIVQVTSPNGSGYSSLTISTPGGSTNGVFFALCWNDNMIV